MLLEALQDFEWYNEPENVNFRDTEIGVTAMPQTDFWQSKNHGYSKDNGHFFFARREDDFSFAAKWSLSEITPYNQCGVMLRVDANNWIKAAIIYDSPQRPMIGTSVTQNGYSDWAAQDIPQGITDIWFKIKRAQGDYMVYYSLDGEKYKQMRLTHLLNDLPEIKVGAYICTPANKAFSAALSQIELK